MLDGAGVRSDNECPPRSIKPFPPSSLSLIVPVDGSVSMFFINLLRPTREDGVTSQHTSHNELYSLCVFVCLYVYRYVYTCAYG